MNNNTKLKLSEMVKCGILEKNKLKKLLKNPETSNSNIKKLVKSCNEFSIEDVNQFKIKIFDSWNTIDNTFESNEITVLSKLLNSGCVMTRQELINKTKIPSYRMTKAISRLIGTPYDNAIDGLIEEGLIGSIPINGNEILIFINKNKFYSFLGNSKNE